MPYCALCTLHLLLHLQVQDQVWERDNLGLLQNCQTGTPVRVFRGSRDQAGETQYTYEGLYAVKEAKRIVSVEIKGGRWWGLNQINQITLRHSVRRVDC